MKNTKSIKLLVVGGSGLWTEKNHYPSILGLKNSGLDVRVAAICDHIDPANIEKGEKRVSLKKVLRKDNPIWLNPEGMSDQQLTDELDNLHKQFSFGAVIVATDPVHHYFYCKWALTRAIPLLCDKPLITEANSSFDVNQARLIQTHYEELMELYQVNLRKNPNYMFCSPLRRRALTPFRVIAKELERIHHKTNEGIRYMDVIINGGIHKYPSEYTKGGAHGHLGGVGTLSHSSYHYIDVIAWYLLAATGTTKKIEITVPYVLRVGDYLKTESYKNLRTLIEGPTKKFNDQHDFSLPQQVLDSELDCNFYLKLLDKQNHPVGLISFAVNYSTYTPRLTKYNPDVTEYAHDKYGGRMSSVYFDIHQGPVQQWQLIKNDIAAEGHNIELRQYLHPKLGKKMKKYSFSDAYESATYTSKDLFKSFILAAAGMPVPKKNITLLSMVKQQALTSRIYSAMYEQLAKEYMSKKNSQIAMPTYIEIDGYK